MNVPPARALAIAAILDAHPKRLPHWDTWAAELRTWAHQHITAPSEEGEIPSQDWVSVPERGRMGSAPGERANAHAEGLTTRTCKEVDVMADTHGTRTRAV